MPEMLILPVITLAFILLDVLTGVLQAVANKELSSVKMRQGLLHKVGFMCAMLLGYLCEYAAGYMDLGFQIPMGSAVCAYICLMELLSIIENLGRLAPELGSSKFLSLFGVNKEDEDESEEA